MEASKGSRENPIRQEDLPFTVKAGGTVWIAFENAPPFPMEAVHGDFTIDRIRWVGGNPGLEGRRKITEEDLQE
jgi:hypothetical protein